MPSTPYRDSSASRHGGVLDPSTSPTFNAAVSVARSNARVISGPDTRTGPHLNRSSSETRAPSGTVNSESPGIARRPIVGDTPRCCGGLGPVLSRAGEGSSEPIR
ncbi:hypothetical protein ABT120_07240 [Nonomuraea angiospora]|uniref:hypothetical protein n=1 Tax=Nonomuraea angiospora TaxID=46172 RepID=UPI00332CD906